MTRPWPVPAPTEIDGRIRELEEAAYEHFGLRTAEETFPLHSPIGEVEVRVRDIAADPGEAGDVPADAPPVLMLHGVGSFSVLAVELMAQLRGRRLLVLDWPGHGLSGGCIVPGPAALRPMAIHVIEGVLDELGVAQVDLVAHSLGGQFACYAALDIPQRVRRLVLLGCPGGAFPGGRPLPPMVAMAVPHVGEQLMARLVSAERFDRFNDLAIGPGAGAHLPEQVHQACFYMTLRPQFAPSVATYLRAIIRGTSLRSSHHLRRGDLERIRQPTLFAWGDRDAFLAPMAAAESIVAVRDHRLLRVPRAGHAPWLDEPELVGAAVLGHLADPGQKRAGSR